MLGSLTNMHGHFLYYPYFNHVTPFPLTDISRSISLNLKMNVASSQIRIYADATATVVYCY